MRRPFFYGWFLVAVAWVLYGFGISPAYYSWGFFAPEVIRDLGLSRAEMGYVFGLFTFLYSGVGPVAGMAISRWGVRAVMTFGALLAAAGFLLLSRMDSLLDGFLYYAVLGGLGIGLSTILPCQTLATNWFVRYRARAVAIIFIAGGIAGRIVTQFDAWMVQAYSWRTGWVWIAGVSTVLALLAAVFVRDNPEDVGQEPDGGAPPPKPGEAPKSGASLGPHWSAGRAMRTPQFALLCLAGLGYAVPWGIVVQHGRLHLEDLGFSTETAASILGTMILISIAGRLSGSLGDFIPPQFVLGGALVLETVGVAGLLFATTPVMAYAATIAIGLGFGASYITITVVFSNFFGRRAFATTTGTRFLVTGTFNALAPGIAGAVFDSLGTYQPAFIGMMVVSGIGAVASFVARPPTEPQPEAAVAASAASGR